jgi:hypothetical protein
MMIALGSGIQSSDRKNIVTTVDQRLNVPGRILSKGQQKDGTKWLHLDSTAYFFPRGEIPMSRLMEKKGNWQSVDEASGDKTRIAELLTIFLEHNASDHYAYAVMPKTSLAATKRMEFSQKARVISNTSDQQSVETRGTVMAVFHNAGSAKFLGSTFVCDRPCIVILKKQGDRTKMSIADLDRKNEKINVSFNGIVKVVTLPDGEMKGSSLDVLF